MTGAPTPGTGAGRFQRTAAAAIILAVACWIAFVSFDVEDPQPYLFPQLFSGIMAVLALIVVYRAARGLDRTAAGNRGADVPQYRARPRGDADLRVPARRVAGFLRRRLPRHVRAVQPVRPEPAPSVRSWAVRFAVTSGFIAVIYAVFAQGLKVHTPEGALF